MSSQTSTKLDGGGSSSAASGGMAGRILFAWAVVGVPLAYGVFETAKKAAALFTG